MTTLNRLSGVLAKPQRSIVDIVSVNANNTTTVRHSDGSKSVVLGDSVASGKMYIENGVVVAKAADLPYTEIEV